MTFESAHHLTTILLRDFDQSPLFIGFHALFSHRLGASAQLCFDALEAGLDVVQRFPPFRLELIRCLRELELIDLAIENLEALIDELPLWGEARREQIFLELEQGAFERAEALFNEHREKLSSRAMEECSDALERSRASEKELH